LLPCELSLNRSPHRASFRFFRKKERGSFYRSAMRKTVEIFEVNKVFEDRLLALLHLFRDAASCDRNTATLRRSDSEMGLEISA